MNSEAKVDFHPTPADIAEIDIAEAERATNAELNVSVEPGTLSTLPPAERPTAQQLKEQLSLLIERLNQLFAEYKQPVTVAGVALAAIPFLVLTVSILEVIDTIPLLSSAFELIGFGYTSWFIYRYLLLAEKRQEFVREFEDLKERILGKSNLSL